MTGPVNEELSNEQRDEHDEWHGPGRLSESAWSLSWPGVRTVYLLELRQRLRSRWWGLMILAWFAILALLTALIYTTVIGDNSNGAGATMFSVVALLVLSLAALVSPALSATSVNGDRAHGVLAVLQSSLLTPAELVIGKILAAWTSALSLIAAALPFLAWGFLLGGTSLLRLLVVIALIAVELLVVCAIGVGCSAMISRTSASSAQTYLIVTMLGLGLPLVFVLSLAAVHRETTVMQPQITYSQNADGSERTNCAVVPVVRQQAHTELTWWILAASPYVVVADAAPATAGLEDDDVLGTIRDTVRTQRLGPQDVVRTCALQQDYEMGGRPRNARVDRLSPVWPYGLAIDLGIGLLFAAGAIRRLRTPAGQLPRDTRIA